MMAFMYLDTFGKKATIYHCAVQIPLLAFCVHILSRICTNHAKAVAEYIFHPFHCTPFEVHHGMKTSNTNNTSGES
jgi:hypothetical protein